MGKKASATRASRRQAAQTQHRTDRAAYVHRRPATEPDETYWHGGWPGLGPGTVLVGAAEASQHGIDLSRYKAGRLESDPFLTSPHRVYFSSNRDFAKAFASRLTIRDTTTGIAFQRGALYRVEPLGDVEVDPDFRDHRISWCAPRARIIAVEDPNVMVDTYTATEWLGPYMSWSDRSPVYSTTGEYLLSPDQIHSGQVVARQVARLPWTPLDHIDAALNHRPSGSRPMAANHPDIAMQAAEAVAVTQRHFDSAGRLTQQGVEFSNDYLPVRDQVNALIEPVELSMDESRGVVVASHPQDGVIGACVVTASQMHEQLVMFIDRVGVAPTWRHQGLGSVMLSMAQQLLPNTVDFAAGHCPREIAPFFVQLGYTLLNPGVPLILPVDKDGEDNPALQVADDCWFYRQGRI
ncbi:GNAT family N-acetyltransferase [Ornithinimicrobium murale]|uniref:GNAT family N-acetyltransferase n=1 Tax=Ornithinimicrobium murale TaxID=1050153 RepID=UPI0013B46E80|nr:GNAT family N-acetyltransferase [Ornithinimicrobium murale]